MTGLRGIGGGGDITYLESTWTPVATLNGGSGNTVPVYTTNQGIYTRVGRLVHIDIYLADDGGAEGAGTGVIYLTLPITPAANHSGWYQPVGTAKNGSSLYGLMGAFSASNGLVLGYSSSATAISDFTGALQNNTSRHIQINAWYRI